ncbi:type IX secretion system membrane protein PorP/SprF [Flavobacterium sp.]|jgi:type IX secretion system PorP/SprF family membrane protein|uniref:type IX secretion system membrane protein PorP/SprF n=1 Tax=Flavobacterium sp. TaxID=239 RepID=UPI0037C0CEF6
MRRIYLVLFIVSFYSLGVYGQQDPHYTQYMYNMSVMNPAYAGSKESLSMGLLHRRQWVDIEGAPTTSTFFGHSPVGKNVGMGLSVINDKLGPIEENNIYGDFSYTLQLGGSHRLALGLKAGLTLHHVGLFSEIGDPSLNALPDLGDEAFSQNTSNSYFNFGSGLFYYTNKYYLAFSVPNIVKGVHLDVNGRSYGSEVSHYFLTGGYVFDLNESVKFKPFFMLKSAFNAPTSLDLSSNFLFKDKFEIGATYRLDDSFGAMVNYAITPSLKLGYAYDHIVSDLKVTTPASHEIILLFDVNFSKKVSRSPRYF